MNSKQVFGFTLIELMVVIAIAGIFMSVALPDFSKMVESYRLKEAVESLKSDLMFARTEAIKQSRDVAFSRTYGNAGSWCYGLNVDTSCTCTTAGSCAIKTVSGSNFSSMINMESAATSNSTFDFRRGTIGANGVTFSTTNFSSRVVFSDGGRVRICTPSGETGLAGYPGC